MLACECTGVKVDYKRSNSYLIFRNEDTVQWGATNVIKSFTGEPAKVGFTIDGTLEWFMVFAGNAVYCENVERLNRLEQHIQSLS